MASEASLPQQAMTSSRIQRSARRAEIGWLVWKECRQLTPLFVLLAGIAFLVSSILLLQGLVTGNDASSSLPIVLVAFPGIFATGVGPLLIGQERAAKTLDWLCFLPIGFGRIYRLKCSVALVGLAAMWGIHFVLLFIAGMGHLMTDGWWMPSSLSRPVGYLTLIVHSVYVLQCGIYVAWRIQHPFHSLLTLIPMAALPLLVIMGLQGAGMIMIVEPGILLLSVLGILLLTPLGYRAAIRTMGAKPAPSVPSMPAVPGFSSSRGDDFSGSPQLTSPTSAFVWQNVFSTPATWLILFTALVACFAVFVTVLNYDPAVASRLSLSLFACIAVVIGLVVTWCGVMVFKFDGDTAHVQFLSQRGVAPWKILLGRHAVPVAMLSACCLVYGVWQWLVLANDASTQLLSRALPLPSLPLLLGCGLVLYSAGQWISQLFRHF
ncbi:MAG: hypothetical protein AAGJ83_08390, partial [Planctomycetota bacterium]